MLGSDGRLSTAGVPRAALPSVNICNGFFREAPRCPPALASALGTVGCPGLPLPLTQYAHLGLANPVPEPAPARSRSNNQIGRSGSLGWPGRHRCCQPVSGCRDRSEAAVPRWTLKGYERLLASMAHSRSG